jgi:hypothetical protein
MHSKYLGTIFGSTFSLSVIQGIETIPVTDISEIIKLLIQLGIGIATIINLLRKRKQK